MTKFAIIITFLLVFASVFVEAEVTNQAKTRLIVTTDISSLAVGVGEPDDAESLIRLLLYANDFDIEGLIATHTSHSSQVHPGYIKETIREYGKVQPNLLKHDPRYPSEEYLLEKVKAGSPDGNALGQGKDTEGSEWIISVVDKPDSRPVWIIIWGGPRELAQALWKVQQERTPEQFSAFKSKIRVYAINDQDATASWIKSNHPDLFYITGKLSYRGMYRGGDESLVTPKWVTANLKRGHGALGAAYPNYKGGDPWSEVFGIKEGDTPSFLYLIPNGLGDPMQPTWGSWGGRFSGAGPQYFDAKDDSDGAVCAQATVYRWRPAFQADFQARMDWCVKSYKDANHAPVAVLDGDSMRTVRPGEVVNLSAAGSSDPDGDKLSYNWYFYSDPGTYYGPLTIKNHNKRQASFVAPEVDSPKVFHIILTVTDDGEPKLSSYRRVVVTVEP